MVKETRLSVAKQRLLRLQKRGELTSSHREGYSLC